ncbi:DUF3830 family protein, partial [Pseudomonas sp. CM25]|uniref:DUF3830 family protein n=1 Tax=Pseudomonas sp. CM25 TaxID=2738448 RepID=UPI0015559574
MTTSLSIANPLTKRIRLSEQASGLSVSFEVLQGLAPDNAEFLWDFLAEPREMPALHAMWSGPEISCPIPSGLIPPDWSTRALPNENATVTPQAGDLVLIYVPARMWGGNSQPIFDLGFFYGHGGRLLFPVGW